MVMKGFFTVNHWMIDTNREKSVSGSGAGAILAFSWACNDAVMTSDSSVMKCAFCDTQFISKGAYRHHLSKMHFVKDPPAAPAPAPAAPADAADAAKNDNAKNDAAKSDAGDANFEETPHSKFLKYTELAKQLSSKYVWIQSTSSNNQIDFFQHKKKI